MPIADEKKVQALIQGCLTAIGKLEQADTLFQTIKTKYNNAAPDLAGSNMTTQQVQDANALITAVNDVLSTHSAIIATLKGKDIPSHGTKSLD